MLWDGQKCGVRSDLIFGPRAGDGVALITADGSVFWDADKAGKTGQEVEALMHSAVLEKRCVGQCGQPPSLCGHCAVWSTTSAVFSSPLHVHHRTYHHSPHTHPMVAMLHAHIIITITLLSIGGQISRGVDGTLAFVVSLQMRASE